MNISHFSIRRPIFTIMIALVVIILGVVALQRLPVDLMPDITWPTLSVSTTYENASPEEIERLVTEPIEEAMKTVPGQEEVTSVSSEGRSSVRVAFAWGTDLDAAASDVRDRLDRVISRLPEEADRPSLRKFDLASFPVLILGATSDLDPREARRIIDDQVAYRIERVPGVAALDVHGGLDREIHVDLSPDKMKALGLPLDQVLARIQAGNVNLPAGTIQRGNFEVTVRTPGEFTSREELCQTVVATRDGAPIRLDEIADVTDTSAKVSSIVRVNGKSGIHMAVNKQSGTNTVEVATRVLQEVEGINRDNPQIQLIPMIDTSKFIQRSIHTVGSAVLFGGLFAVLVLLFFLRSFKSTAIIATAIPVSIVATFGLMYFGKLTLNIMTLGGLALGVGMLVDNAIVVLENIFRLRQAGLERTRAALQGSEEVINAIVASTLTTLAVFVPMVFVRGMSGVMFRQLALVIGFALLCSLGVALTVVPMLASRLRTAENQVSPGHESVGHWAFRVTGRMFTGMENAYKRLLHFALGHRWPVVVGAAAALAGSLILVPLVGTEYMPQTDEGEVSVEAEMEVATRLSILDEKFKVIEAVVREAVPELQNLVTSVGGRGWRGGGGHTGSLRVTLPPRAERKRSSEEIAMLLSRQLAQVPGVLVRTRVGQGFFFGRRGMGGGSERVQIEIRGFDLEVAETLAERVKTVVEDVPGVTDARISRDIGTPEELILVDRQRAADMKVTVSAVASMLQTVLSGTRASNFREGGNEYPIRVQLQGAERRSLDEILDLTLTNAEGEPVVLRNLVDVRPRRGPVLIERKDRERILTVSANIAGRDLGSVVADMREGLKDVPVPRGFAVVFGGDYEEQQKAFRELLLSIVLAIVLVYIVMACQYESLIDPFVVMFAVPLAAIGVILMLFLTHTTFNVQSFIGCIMLAGIVVNNAILLVDHTNLLRRRDGLPIREAIEEAGRRRLRPILMTAFTTSLAMLPLALGLGEGGEAQAPMARAVIGGLLSASLITLVFVPVIYSLFERGGGRVHAARRVTPGGGPGGEDASAQV
ncbi:MAG: acriflavin resistance protein [Planctomycetes bacterium DG_20]|nr:MAG: acriflavin resistance protein [Planctomycetes bacterium DG_20]